jgi:hypothetical protein
MAWISLDQSQGKRAGQDRGSQGEAGRPGARRYNGFIGCPAGALLYEGVVWMGLCDCVITGARAPRLRGRGVSVNGPNRIIDRLTQDRST